MTITWLVTLIATWLAAIMAPGPDTFQLTRVSTRDRQAGVWCALGIMIGNAIWIVASLAGLSALVIAHPGILTVLQLAGGSFLIYLGILSLRGGLRARRRPTDLPDAPTSNLPRTRGQALRLGVLTNLSNPKALLFFGAVFSRFVTPGMGWGTIGVILVTLLSLGMVWFVGFAVAVGALGPRILRFAWLIDVLAGVLFSAVGLVMLGEVVRAFL